MELSAWLLNFGKNHRAVVGQRELLHLIPNAFSLVQTIPRTPLHCSKVLNWQNQVIPVWDVNTWLLANERVDERTVSTSASLAVLIGYQPQPKKMPQLGALMLVEPPLRITISTDQECTNPTASPWRALASAFLVYEEEQLAVLDLRRVFSGLV